jgi:hypothetical protein
MDWKALQMATSGQQQPAQQSGGFGMVGSGMSAPQQQATDPYAFIKQNYNMADEAGSTRKIWDEAQRQGWGNDVLGQGLGFSGQQVTDHFAKYGLGGQGGGAPDMGIPTPVQSQQAMSPSPTQMGQGMMGNPYLQGMGDDIGRRTQQMLDANLGGIRSNAIMAGGYGGSRQGVAEGQAISGAADAMQGNLSNMFGQAYNADSNRMVQRYGLDQNYNLGLGGLTNQAYGNETQRGLGVGSLQNQAMGQAQNFYTAQRGQDQTGMALGANLAQQGLQTPWAPIQNASSTYAPYTGFGTSTTGGSTGGGWQGAIGGALGGAQLGKNMGWW